MLLAAFAARRPTMDIDLVARDLLGDVAVVLALVRWIAAELVDHGLVGRVTFGPGPGGVREKAWTPWRLSSR